MPKPKTDRKTAWDLRRYIQGAIAPEKLDYTIELSKDPFLYRATCISFSPEIGDLVVFDRNPDVALVLCRDAVKRRCALEADKLLEQISSVLDYPEGEVHPDYGPAVPWGGFRI